MSQRPSPLQISKIKSDQPSSFEKNLPSLKQNDWTSQRLATKLYVPKARSNFVYRQRLIDRLNEGGKNKLTLVCAPAGFGKTSVLASWLKQTEIPAAWVSLDAEDNEPARFLDYLIGALQTVDNNLGATASDLLQSSHPLPLKPALSGLINEIAELENDFVLVLDDYHLVHELEIHESIAFFLEHLPQQAHLIIASRNDLPFPVARLRAKGEMTEIRAADLRFDTDESSIFLNELMDLDLSSEDIGRLENRTEGWITGLQLSALSLQGRKNKSDLISEFAGNDRFILDYLVEEVLNSQPPNVQDFLLQTAVLNRLSGDLCNALTEKTDGQMMLEQLERANLFLFPLDNKAEWFRYHHLFADFLRFKFKQKQPDKILELQTKASLWCEKNDLTEESIGYALAAEDWERALSLLEPIGYQFVSLGKFERLKRWIEDIPEYALKTRPMLCFWYIPTLLYKDEFEKAEKYLQIIETSEPEEVRNNLLSSVWASRCFMAVACGNLTKAMQLSQKSFDLLPPNDVIQFAVATHTRVAYTFLQGDMTQSEQTLLEALPNYRQAKHFLFETWARTYLGFVCAMQGRLQEGAEELQSVIKFAKENIPKRPDPQIYPNSFLCDIYRERNELETAKFYLEEALKLINQTGRVIYMVLDLQNLKSLILMLEQCGDTEQSQKILESGLKQVTKYQNETVIKQINALAAFINLRRGDIAFTDNWAKNSGLSADDTPDYQSEPAHLTFARWLIAREKPEQASVLLSRLQSSAEEGKRQRIVLETMILQSIAQKNSGDENKAVEIIEKAVKFGESENFIRSFTDEGETVYDLLQIILKKRGKIWGNESPRLLNYVLTLIKSFGENDVPKPISAVSNQAEDLPWWYRNDPLSEREIEVLALVAQGFSNQQIGNKLFIAAGTVKRHINNIYSKLDVHSRVQAIELARKFGII